MSERGPRRRPVPPALAELVATRVLDPVEPNPTAIAEWINDAARHLRSARIIAPEDPRAAIALLHDALRKALTALASHLGFRLRGGEGSHAIAVEFGRAALPQLGEELWDQVDELRRLRNASEYGDVPSRRVTVTTVSLYAPVADSVVAAVRASLQRRR